MEEVIGYVIVGLVVLGLYLGIKKLFKKKTGLFTYEDEIILDKKMLHYGPFSGAFVYPHRKFILLLSISSSFLTAEWDIRTIDGWGIDSYSNENLIMHKTGDDTSTNFYIEMARPFCITSEPTLTIPVGNLKYSIDSEIEATMTVDRGVIFYGKFSEIRMGNVPINEVPISFYLGTFICEVIVILTSIKLLK